LKRPGSNDPEHLDRRNDLIDFFERMATGLADLAAALDEAISGEQSAEPFFLGKAQTIVSTLQSWTMEYLEANRMKVIEVPIKYGLFGLGIAFLTAIGVEPDMIRFVSGVALGRLSKYKSKGSKKKKE
jgi:hypothetical protein